MKTVFSTKMCAHVWARQTQSHGRGPSVHFDGPTFYSYSTAIACIYAKENLVLFNERTYSQTTSSKHMPAAYSAVRHIPSVSVPIVGPHLASDHKTNLDYLIKKYADYGQTLRRARDAGDWRYLRLEEYANDVKLYALAFKRRTPHIDAEHDIAELKAFRAEREARLNTPANAAKRERAAAMRETYRANAEARKRAKLLANSAERVAKFRNQERDFMYIHGLPYALLRISRDGAMVETSQGAHAPVADARHAVKFIAAVKTRGHAWVANGEKLPVGEFQVDSIDSTGDIRAGCHRIEWSEIVHLAGLLGMMPELPA